MSEIYVANTDALVVLDDVHYPIVKGVTTVREGHPLLDGREALFGPIVPVYDLPDPEPDAAEVRAWAKANDLKCPGRGKIPPDVLDAYKAAQAAAAAEAAVAAQGVEDEQQNLTGVEDAARDLSGTETADQAGA